MFTTLAFLLNRLASFSMLFVQEVEPSDFDDLGMLLLGGALLAVAVGVAVSVVRLKFHNNEYSEQQFISIKSSENKEP